MTQIERHGTVGGTYVADRALLTIALPSAIMAFAVGR